LDGFDHDYKLGTVLEKIAETTNSKDSRSKSEKSLEQSQTEINKMQGARAK